jgi:hypothetical protein
MFFRAAVRCATLICKVRMNMSWCASISLEHPERMRKVRRVGVMTSEEIIDVLIVGAGATGLAARRELHRAGRHAQVLEARARLGGRILTNYSTPTPIELGAEFIHGRPKVIHSILEEAQLPVIEVLGKHLVYDKDHRLGPIFTRSSRASTGRWFQIMKPRMRTFLDQQMRRHLRSS